MDRISQRSVIQLKELYNQILLILDWNRKILYKSAKFGLNKSKY